MSTHRKGKAFNRKDEAFKKKRNLNKAWKPWKVSKCKKARVWIQEKTYPQTQWLAGSREFSGHCGYQYLFAHQPQSYQEFPLDPTSQTPSNNWPKTTKQPAILPTKWAYLGTAKNCNWVHAIYGEPQASLENIGEKRSFLEEKGKLGRAVMNEESIGGSWDFKV